MNAQRPGQTHLLGLLSLACDLSAGMPPGHAMRAVYVGRHIAEALGLPPRLLHDTCVTLMLKDAGSTAWASQLADYVGGDEIAARRDTLLLHPLSAGEELSWAFRRLGAGELPHRRALRFGRILVNGRSFDREGLLNAGEVAGRVAERMGASATAQRALRSRFEHWDGSGLPEGLKGDEIPLLSRIVPLAGYIEVAHSTTGREAALKLARRHKGKRFDPAVVNAFEKLAAQEQFWHSLEQEPSLQALLDGTLVSAAPEATFADAALCCADLVDLKSPWLAGHSRRVANQAQRLARLLHMSDRDTEEVWLAGLFHDVGLLGVPSSVLNKLPDSLESHERESLQNHPASALDLLLRFSELSRIARIAAAHHERIDDSGYYASLASGDLSFSAGLIGAAARFDELTHGGPGAPPLDPEQALAQVESGAGGFKPEIIDALRHDVFGTPPHTQPEAWPAGLSDREVEVIHANAMSLTSSAAARRLSMAEKDLQGHFERIFGKTNTTTRAGVTLFALENGLFD